MNQESLKKFCAKGATVRENWLTMNKGVSLRVLFFSAASRSHEPTVVFIPGWISRLEGWQTVLKEMTRHFNVIYVETREKISAQISGEKEYDVEAIGGDIVSLVKQLDFSSKEFILFGSSLGATAILDCASQLPVEPRALVLIGPNAEFRVPWWGKAIIYPFYPGFYFVLKPLVKWYLKVFRLNIKADRAQFEKYCKALDEADPWKLKKGVIPLSRYTVWDKLQAIPFQTLIVGGEKDILHEPDNLKKMHAMMNHSTYLDMETNAKSHSPEMVHALRHYLSSLTKEVKHGTKNSDNKTD